MRAKTSFFDVIFQNLILDIHLSSPKKFWFSLNNFRMEFSILVHCDIGHGDNGPSAKPLFSTFRAEGHVTSTCLWHACRAVTIGALLIVMGMTMSILGKFNFNLRL